MRLEMKNNNSQFRLFIWRPGGMHLRWTCDFQQCGVLTSVDSVEPVQPRFNLRNSK